MKELIQNILNLFKKTNTPIEPLPPKLLLSGGIKRLGVSAEELASEIISRQSEAGAPFGEVFNGATNVAESMEIIRCQVILEHLITNAKIEIVIAPGVPVRTVGANSGGTLIATGVTTDIASGTGVIR